MQDLKVYTSKQAVSYSDALSFMDKYVDGIIDGTNTNALWLLEHPSIYTKGTSSNDNELLCTYDIPIYETNRGGKITYHGPGQRVVYLMLNLKSLYETPDVKKFIKDVQQWIINTLGCFEIKAIDNDSFIGVWVEDPSTKSLSKIAAIGIRIKKWVTFHGVAINIYPNLSHFNGIIPCGITEYGVTSMEAIGRTLDIKQIDEALLTEFSKVFSCNITNYHQL